MRPPAELDATGRAAWRRAHAVLVAIGEDPELCSEPLSAYGRAISDVGRLRRRWRALGHEELEAGPRGLLAEHPLLARIERAERWAAQCGAALGLDPQARRKLSRRVLPGSRPGTATAADRAAPARRSLKAVE